MGAIVYELPSVPFSVPRGYCTHIGISADFSSEPFWDGQVIQFDSAAGYTYRLAVSDDFYPFSTVAYTLDRVMDAGASSIDCHLFPCSDGVLIRWKIVLNGHAPTIELQPLATLTTKRLLLLPPAPPDYWLSVP